MTRERRRKVGLIVVGVLAALAARTAVSTWRSTASLEARWPGLVAERREAERRAVVPALRGAPRAENAAPRYLALLPRLDRELREEHWDLEVGADPFAPIASATLAALASHGPVLTDLRDLLGCERCDWEQDYDLPLVARKRPFELLGLGKLLVAEGHRRAQAGDAPGAAACYLDSVRFRADLGRARSVLAGSDEALEALGRLVASTHADALDLDTVEAELDRALLAFLGPEDELAQARLEVLGTLLRARVAPDPARSMGLEVPAWLDHSVGGRLMTLDALGGFDRRWDEAARALAAGDVEALAADREELHRHGWGQGSYMRLPSWNPIGQLLDASMAVEIQDDLQTRTARGALIHAACALERAHRAGGAPPPPPLDPFTGAPLSVELRPDGYLVSTPGRPRGGCCGGPKPLALERRW